VSDRVERRLSVV